MKLALVHDWLQNLGGAERVLIELHEMYPQAPIYVLFYNKKFAKKYLPKAEIRTSFLQKIPFITKIYPACSWLMPIAIESLDLSEFNRVLSSSVTFAKGLILRPSTKHICYCYSPTRFLWDRNVDYSNNFFTRIAQHLLRIWDRGAAQRVDQFITISHAVQQRIKKYYRRDSIIIYPPITLNVTNSTPDVGIRDYYLIVSRLYDYKNIHLAIQTFNKLGYPLHIIGDGPASEKLKQQAKSNIQFLGYLSDEQLCAYYKNCKALIMPQEEDFGLAPIEAMSFGKPVIALRHGGALETVLEGQTGEFFDDPIPQALADTVRRFNEKTYDSNFIKEHASQFSKEYFRLAIRSILTI